jgi:type IV pilus assembly protein PilX
MQHNRSCTARQRGAVLVVSLILLLVMTILALAISQSSRMEERMTGNSRDSDLAFQAAEAGLRGAEDRLTGLATRPLTCASPPCVVFQENSFAGVNLANQSDTWWTSNATQYGAVPDVARPPQYITEQLPVVRDNLTTGYRTPTGIIMYHNVARSVGGTTTAQAVIESTFATRF